MILFFRHFAMSALLLVGMNTYAQNALDFDGVNDYVETNYSGISGSSARTVEAWIKTTANALPVASGGTGQKVIVDWGTFTNGARFTFNLLWANSIRIEVGGNGLSGTTPVNDGNWHHVACVYDPSAPVNYSLYIDGALETSGNLTVATNTGTLNDVRIGSRIDGINHFDGEIDEVRIWNTVRTPAEISGNMNNEFCAPQPGLVSYFKLNEGIAQGVNSGLNTAVDAVNSTQNGTLNGFALTGASSNWVNGYSLSQAASFGSITTSACGGLTSPSGNYFYSMPGMYMDTISNDYGCDSIITINLTSVSPNSFSTVNASACNAYVSPSGNYVYISSGTYTDTLPSASGCDSIITVNLSILESFDTIDVEACYGLLSPSGNFYLSIPGTYQDTITNMAGCDSILTINLGILGFTSSNSVDTSCFEFTSPSGKVWTESGFYEDTISNSIGCDSIITIQLTIEGFDRSLDNLNGTLVSPVIGGVYQWINCQTGNMINGANARTFRPTASGQYAVIIEKDGCSDTSSCEEVIVLGTQSLSFGQNVNVFPNPFHDILTVNVSTVREKLHITVLDMYGRTIAMNGTLTVKLNQGENQVDFSLLPPGNYVLRISDDLTNEFVPIVKIY